MSSLPGLLDAPTIWPLSCCSAFRRLLCSNLTRENAELKVELTRIRQEAEALRRLLVDSSVQRTSSEDLRETAT